MDVRRAGLLEEGDARANAIILGNRAKKIADRARRHPLRYRRQPLDILCSSSSLEHRGDEICALSRVSHLDGVERVLFSSYMLLVITTC